MSKCKYTINREDLMLQNVEVGQEFTSYKELCEAVGIEAKQGGASRASQIKELKKHIDFQNISRKKIVITEIYLIEKPKLDARKDGNNSVYREDFLSIIIVLLRNASKNYLLLSRAQLIKELGLVNDNYTKCKYNSLETAKKLNIPEQNLLDFFMITDTRLISNVESNLKFFKDKYFNVDEVTAVRVKGKLYPRIATHDEKELIEICKNKAKKALGIESTAEIFSRNLWESYNEKVSEELNKRGSNITSFYSSYDFSFDRERIEELYQIHVKGRQTTRTKSRKAVNKNSRLSALESIERRKINEAKRRESGKNKKYANLRDEMIRDKNFDKYSKELVRTVININAKQISFLDDDKEQDNMCTFENYLDENTEQIPF